MNPMERRSLLEYLANFLRRERECAYVQRRGYRTDRWSYRQVAETAFQVARELEVRGISKGDPILIWGSNSAEWVAAFFGCALRGAIVVPMDDVATADFALRVYRQVDSKLLLCSRQHIQSSIPTLILEGLSDSVAHHARSPYAPAATEPSDPLEIVFTSGTTADPKGVVISHGNVLANIGPLETEIRKYLKYERFVHPVRFLSLLPLSHVFGQFLGIFLPQLMGGTVIFQEALKPAEVIGAIRRERVSVLVAVPRLLQSLKEKLERDLADQRRLEEFQGRFKAAGGKHFLHRWWIFRSVHRQFGWKFWAFISGGATLDPVTEEFWGRLGYAVVQGYGLTETTSLISVNHPFHLGKGSIGKVLAGREVKLAPDGEEADHDAERCGRRGACQDRELGRPPPDLGRVRRDVPGGPEEDGVAEGQEPDVSDQETEGAGEEVEAEGLHEEERIDEERRQHENNDHDAEGHNLVTAGRDGRLEDGRGRDLGSRGHATCPARRAPWA